MHRDEVTEEVIRLLTPLAKDEPPGGLMGLLMSSANTTLKRCDSYGIDFVTAVELAERLSSNGVHPQLSVALVLSELWSTRVH